jgi:hypothetical protein
MLTKVKIGYEQVSHEEFLKIIFKAGLGKVKHILHETEVLDWDNNCWIVEMNNGEFKAITTSDADFIEVPFAKLQDCLDRTRANALGIEKALSFAK